MADKRNSHIIPRFLNKRLFDVVEYRHTMEIDNKGKERKIQNTPAEDYILCSLCEKRFEIIETYFARRFDDLNQFVHHPDKFKLFKIEKALFLESNFKPNLFLLFVYSLIWRTSISSHKAFLNFKLPQEIEENIRIILDTDLGGNHKEMLNKTSRTHEIAKPIVCIIRALEYSDETRGLLCAYSLNKNDYILFTTEFLIFIYTDSRSAPLSHKNFSIDGLSKVIIPLAPTNEWNDIRSNIFRKFNVQQHGT